MRNRSFNRSPLASRDVGPRRSVSFERLEDRLYLTTVTFTSPSSNGGDGIWSVQQRDGVDVHVGSAYLYYNTSPAAFPGFQVGDSMYLKVNYYDEGAGTLRVEYDSLTDNFDDTEFHTRSSRVNTQQFVSSYHLLENVQFANGGNGHDFRVNAFGAPVSTVELSDEPFPDSGLEWAWSPPWEAPYTGQSRPVDASTLQGKVLTGYQGWFNTPNDAADEGYVHWGQPGNWSIEQWPDPNDYDSTELFAVPGVSTASGEQAYLFSSANASVVNRHFQWMRQHDIDGALVQRFEESFMFQQGDGSYVGEPQWPVVNARDAAHREGRTWAIEYDIQKGGSVAERWQTIQNVKDDWEYLTDTNGLDMLNDSHYQREDGKPVVAIFGLYVSSGNSYSTAQQTDLINYFKSRGVYVIGAGRHSESAGQLANAGLHDAYIPWQGYWKGGNSYAPDEATLDGVTDHIPHLFPGFSWTHLQNDDNATSVDREDGNFYWRMIADAANETEAPWYFIGMFDEYDEGTNLIPGTDDPPVPDTDPQGDPLTYQVSDPRPNDWWMALTGVAKQALQGKISINDTMPSEFELQNRSNVGSEAVWQAAGNERLTTVSTPDGQIQSSSFTIDGNTFDAIYSTDRYMHFQVDDDFLREETDGRDVTIEVEYLDAGLGQFGLEYESNDAVYEPADPASLTDTGLWRTHRFELSDAYLGNGQEGGSDFRLERLGGNLFVRRVKVVKESVLSANVDLGATNSNLGLQQVELSGDGQTTAGVVDERTVRQLAGTPESLYMYMRVDFQFANVVRAGLNAIVEVVYQDVGSGTLNIQYDATDAAYQSASPVQLENSGDWRTARFYLDDALFGNRQNGASDFRITGNNIPIDSVRVLHAFGDLIAPELQSADATVDAVENTVSIAWTMSDDWKTDRMDRWTSPEDNRVLIEWTNNSGATWNPLDTAYEGTSANSVSSYEFSSGETMWSDQYTWDTTTVPAGTYQLRVTPIDGRGNFGPTQVTSQIDVNQPPNLPGDYNYDDVVNSADLASWSASYASTVPIGTGADGTANGIVDGGDFLLWQRQVGAAPLASLVATSAAVVAKATHAESQLEASVAENEPNRVPPTEATDALFALLSYSKSSTQDPMIYSEPVAAELAPVAVTQPLTSWQTQAASGVDEVYDELFSADEAIAEPAHLVDFDLGKSLLE